MTNIRVTTTKLEVARQDTSEARVTQIAAEVIQTETSEVRVSGLALEVLRTGVTLGPGPTSTRRAVVAFFSG